MPMETLSLGPVLQVLNLLGIAVFAATGALAAAQRAQTLVTATFFALITGVGGGTIRDLLIGAPVFWVRDAQTAALCLSVAVLIWITPQRWWRQQALEWLDAAGLAAYAVYGVAKALEFGVPPIPAAIMGVVTACAGGILRDMLAGEPSILMRPELYVTAAALASGLYVVLVSLGMPSFASALCASAAGFLLRAAAIHWKLGLPTYRGRH
ncbi:putative membrane protein YeiH [Sphingomonas desiccabilis]|nr:putative membrane protein YeiH [Sphingomonas desiccabilis]